MEPSTAALKNVRSSRAWEPESLLSSKQAELSPAQAEQTGDFPLVEQNRAIFALEANPPRLFRVFFCLKEFWRKAMIAVLATGGGSFAGKQKGG